MKEIEIPGRDIQTVRDIEVDDGTGMVRISLWGEKARSPIKTGQTIRLTHMSPKRDTFYGGLKLTSSHFTKIEVMLIKLSHYIIKQMM